MASRVSMRSPQIQCKWRWRAVIIGSHPLGGCTHCETPQVEGAQSTVQAIALPGIMKSTRTQRSSPVMEGTMADESGLSDQARALLQAHLAAIGLRNGGTSGEPTEQTREAYRELARGGLMGACHTFAGGRESLYRLTEEAFNRRAELIKLEPASHRWRFSLPASRIAMRRAFSPIGKVVSATRSTT